MQLRSTFKPVIDNVRPLDIDQARDKMDKALWQEYVVTDRDRVYITQLLKSINFPIFACTSNNSIMQFLGYFSNTPIPVSKDSFILLFPDIAPELSRVLLQEEDNNKYADFVNNLYDMLSTSNTVIQ